MAIFLCRDAHPQIGHEMGRHEAVWSNSSCKIDLADMQDRLGFTQLKQERGW